MPPLRAHLHGLAAAFLGFFFVCAGTPGLDELKGGAVGKPEARRQIERRAGAAAPIVLSMHWFNDRVRRPVARCFRPLERAFRVSQSWYLYGGGRKTLVWLVVEVDGEEVYRSNDPEKTWGRAFIDHRRIRPMATSLARREAAQGWPGLSRLVLDQARKDFPNAATVTILAERRHVMSDAAPAVHHGRTATAPAWEFVPFGVDRAPLSEAERAALDDTIEDVDEEGLE